MDNIEALEILRLMGYEVNTLFDGNGRIVEIRICKVEKEEDWK